MRSLDPVSRFPLFSRDIGIRDERAMFAPIVEQTGLIGVGPRVADVPTITGTRSSRRTRI
jgi:hypothetical protein